MKTKTLSINDILSDHATATGKAFFLIDIDRSCSTSTRIIEEFSIFGQDVASDLCDSERAFIEVDSIEEAKRSFEKFIAEFDTNTPTAINEVTLFAPGEMSRQMVYTPGYHDQPMILV